MIQRDGLQEDLWVYLLLVHLVRVLQRPPGNQYKLPQHCRQTDAADAHAQKHRGK